MRIMVSRSLVIILVISAILASVATASAHSVSLTGNTPNISCLQPPANVDLSTLSDGQLASYGLPPRPADSKGIPHWRSMVQHAKQRSCEQVPMLTKHTIRETSKNWAGNISIGGGYSAVVADWRVPCVANNPRSASEAMWIGLGGDGNDGGGNLVQTGSESDVNGSGGIATYVWWEIVGANQQNVVNASLFNVACLDSISAEAYNSNGAGCITIEDYTTGTYSGPPCESGWASNGSTAEWIVERPSLCIGCTPGTLANFSPEEAQFTSAQANHSGWAYVGKTTHNYSVMDNSSLSMQCAHPGPISSDGSYFTLYYDVPSGAVCF